MKEITFIYPDDIPRTDPQRKNFVGWLTQKASQFGTLWGDTMDVGVGFVWETRTALNNGQIGRIHRSLVNALRAAGIVSHTSDAPYRLEQRIIYTRGEPKATITLKEG